MKWIHETTFYLTNAQWIGILSIIIVGFILEKVSRFLINSFIKRKFTELDEAKLRPKYKKNLNLSLGIAVFSITFLTGIQLLKLPEDLLSVLLRGGYISLTFGLVWAALHMVDIFAAYFEKLANKTENQLDNLLVPLVRKSSKVLIVSIGIIYLAHSMTLNVANLLAGLGIGGLAVALAAKDTLSNLFGSMTVVLDRPFLIGEYINIGGQFEGVVEEVGFRSTRVRTFYDSVITVPNNQLTNVHIDNYGKRKYRRMTTKIGIQYDTPPKKIDAFCEGIRQLILNHPRTRKDFFHVYFNEFGDSSLNILIYVFWEVPDWSSELQERHRLLRDILRLGHKLEIDFAFPTQTLHLFENNKMRVHQEVQDFESLGREIGKLISNR